METKEKKQAVFLGIRVGVIFVMAVVAIFMIAYYVLSQEFKSLLTDYTISIAETMTSQGVGLVEAELDSKKQRVSSLASSFSYSLKENIEGLESLQFDTGNDCIRMLYVTKEKTLSSDGRKRHIYERQDILDAFKGDIGVYGPYFNEENEYVICYSAPVKKNYEIVGAVSIEIDGYIFCDVIENIRFIKSGESYIINTEGTDIAVSDKNHIDWVKGQYNARKLLESYPNDEVKSIVELEQNGLDGQMGVGTYYWEDGLCYVAYEPIPSVGWVILSGMREEELAAMTQTVIFSAISKGPILEICFLIMFLLMGLIIYWIISSMKKNAEINEKLKIIANFDTLTGLMNRNSFHNDLDNISKKEIESFACIYIDVNGLHELNNHLGHQAGDQMLIAVANALNQQFSADDIYRIGGDEFVILCFYVNKEEIEKKVADTRTYLQTLNYEISIGIAYQENHQNVLHVVNKAEANMQFDKQRYYEEHNKDRRMRGLNKQLEKMILDKQDADTFLTVLAPEFSGVFFVNLNTDVIRHLFIPEYFEDCLKDANQQFGQALILYAKRIVKPEYFHYFEEYSHYGKLKDLFNHNQNPEFVFQKLNGDWIKLRIFKFEDYSTKQWETLWVFTNLDITDFNESMK